jgi:putative hydrolase of the HAD superfamily
MESSGIRPVWGWYRHFSPAKRRWLPSSPAQNSPALPCYTPSAMALAVDTLIFDLDDTLIVEETLAEAAFIETGELARNRHGLDPHSLHRTVRNTCRELWHAFPSHPYCKRIGISSWEGMWSEFTGPAPELKPLRNWAPIYRTEAWKAALHVHGIDDPGLAAEMAEAFPRLRRAKNQLFPDTLLTLEHFSQDYSLGLLTNGASDLQRGKIQAAGIGRYFNRVLISGESGFAKPDRRAYEMILALLGVTADRAIMIGDRLATDIQGAQGVGMRAVWVNRSGREQTGPVAPDWEIPGLEELIRILSEMRK